MSGMNLKRVSLSIKADDVGESESRSVGLSALARSLSVEVVVRAALERDVELALVSLFKVKGEDDPANEVDPRRRNFVRSALFIGFSRRNSPVGQGQSCARFRRTV